MAWRDRAARLTISSYTLGEDLGFEQRVRVAAEAGFAGIGLRVENYVAARREGLDDVGMAAILADHGVGVLEVEYLTSWGRARDRDPAQREETVFHMARTFGVGRMNAGLLERLPPRVIVEGLAGLCRRAGELVVGLEFMPYSGVPDLRTAWAVVQRAGAPNAGLLVDAWHWARAGTAAADLAPVDVDRIVGVQLCDVAEHPMERLREESLHHRLPPGAGYGDVAGMLDALRSKGVDAPISVEVISDELLARGPGTAARTVLAAARRVLDER